MSLPGIAVIISLYSLTGPNIPAAMTAFGVIVTPSFYRLVRSVVISVRSELYVDAAKVVGLSDFRIVGRHVLSAVRAPVIVQSSFVLATAVASCSRQSTSSASASPNAAVLGPRAAGGIREHLPNAGERLLPSPWSSV